MTTHFVVPFPVSILASQTSLTPAANVLSDVPSMTWRSQTLTAAYLTLGLSGAAYDTIALAGTNLRANDTVRIRLGSSQAVVEGLSAPVDITIPAFSGVAARKGALVLYELPSPVSHPYARIDISSPGNPAGYVEVKRLIMGKRVEWDGIDVGAEVSYENESTSIFDQSPTLPVWKAVVSGMSEEQYWTIWDDFLLDIGDKRGFLFLPDINSPYLQKQNAFATLVAAGKTVKQGSDYNSIELNLSTII